MKSFDEFFEENFEYGLSSPAKNIIKFTFEAGQQSKQAEIDELRKRIDEINNHVEINYDENRDDDSHSYWSGYNQALRELFNILKGDQS